MNATPISESCLGVPWFGGPGAAPSRIPSGLVKAFGNRVFSIAKHITQSDEDSENVWVETFLEVYSDSQGCEEVDEMWLKLVTVTVREAFSNLRKRVAAPHIAESPDFCEDVVIRELSAWEDDYPQRYSQEQMTQVLENGLRSLDPMARAVFVLRDIEQIPVERIAGIVNRSVPAVEVCLLRARLQLREMLVPHMRQRV
jgi:RNA polymerase sigma-70 factor (ECF subfamily)